VGKRQPQMLYSFDFAADKTSIFENLIILRGKTAATTI
jgi:hypothetical protein